jgi:hypothetical protein
MSIAADHIGNLLSFFHDVFRVGEFDGAQLLKCVSTCAKTTSKNPGETRCSVLQKGH